MIPQKITNTSVIVAITIATIALVVGLSQTHTTTAQSASLDNNTYIFAEGVYPQATFSFKDATVTYQFQAFTQTTDLLSGTGRGLTPEFTLQRVVGDTPYLHKAVDQTFQNNGRLSALNFPYQEFDVEVELIQDGKTMRAFEYGDCTIGNYKTTTEYDKEEGYTTGGKTGFAVMETYTFSCAGFEPQAPTYKQMLKSTMDRIVNPE